MPRVLIAGCGYLGQAVVDLFQAADWQVEGWTQSVESARDLAKKKCPIFAVDISDPAEVARRGGKFDAVIHCASTGGGDASSYRRVYLDGLRNLIGRFGASSVLCTSSTSVYAQTDGDWVTEESAAQPRHEAGKILRQAEDLLLNAGGVVVRLAGIYGPQRSALLAKFLRGEAAVDPAHDRFVNQIHRDDAAAGLFFLIDRAPNPGAIYNVVDNEPILQSECYRWLATKLNRPISSSGRSVAGSADLREATTRQASRWKRGESHKRVSNAKLRRFGWTPRYRTFAEGMERSVLPSFGRDASPELPASGNPARID